MTTTSTSKIKWLNGVKSRTLFPTAWQAAWREGPKNQQSLRNMMLISANTR
uniref:Uncharacterized protein n=1 Tax=virus sp. ct5rm7 TaxID=2827298 RepID=A0A8S5RH98_9VIRU|nr:MAG TPA: hypothetical protein [virus sp. ct5rm7]